MKRHNTHNDHRKRVLDYLAGKLDAEQQHRMERDAMADPFLADALEGLGKFDASDIEADLSSLDESLAYRQRRRLWPMLWRVASVSLLLLVPGVLVWLTVHTLQKPATLARNAETPALTDSAPQPLAQETEPTHTPVGEKKDTARPQISTSQPTAAPAKAEPTESEGRLTPKQAEPLPIANAKMAESRPTPDLGNVLSGKAAGIRTQPAGATARSRSAAKAEAVKTIHGRVLDDSGQPIIGATVAVKGSSLGAVTNVEGEFSLAVPDTNAVLYTSFIGFKAKETPIDELRDRPLADIVIEPDFVALEEVVVTGYGTQKKSVVVGAVAITKEEETEQPQTGFTPAQPHLGMAKYLKKLESTLQYPASGSGQKEVVVAKLSIDARGTVVHIDIVKAPNNDFAQEAIRAINHAGTWQAATADGKPVESTKRLRIVFDPQK